MHGDAGHFGRETNQHQQEYNTTQSFGRDEIRAGIHQDEIKRLACDITDPTHIVVEVHYKNACEHEDAGCKCVDEELLCRVATVFTTPHENEEEHWNQGQFPKHVEYEQIEADEDTDECTFHHQNEAVEVSTLLCIPFHNHGDWNQ